MGGKTNVKAVYLTDEQKSLLREVAVERHGSLEAFAKAAAAIGKKYRLPFSYWNLPRRIPSYLDRKAVHPNPARVMFAALEQDPRVSFLEEIGLQVLKADGIKASRNSYDSRRHISYQAFTENRQG